MSYNAPWFCLYRIHISYNPFVDMLLMQVIDAMLTCKLRGEIVFQTEGSSFCCNRSQTCHPINPHIIMFILFTSFYILVLKTTSNIIFYIKIVFPTTPWRYVSLGLSQLCAQTCTHMIVITARCSVGV